jgi:hypothetical protein
VEKYGDLITNGLDVISFLLVTPEILKVVAPIGTDVIGMAMALLASLGLYVLILVIPSLLLTGGFPLWVVWATVPLAAAMIFAFIKLGFYDWVIRVSDHASKHLFALGVVVFFISRLIASYGAAVKAGLL